MTSFLGVPIISRGRSAGNFYLTDKAGAPEWPYIMGTDLVGRDLEHAWREVDAQHACHACFDVAGALHDPAHVRSRADLYRRGHCALM